jgi:hypothetical protein
MADGNVTDEEVAELIRRIAEAASALIRGDIRRYVMLIKHADDYTLMAPAGGGAQARLRRFGRGPGSHGAIFSGR